MVGNKLTFQITTSAALVITVQPDANIVNASNGTVIPYVVGYDNAAYTVYYGTNSTIQISVNNQLNKIFAVLYI